MKLFKAQIIDEETDEVLAVISAYGEESLEEDMGKSKWTIPARKAEKENSVEIDNEFDKKVDEVKIKDEAELEVDEDTPKTVDAVVGVGDEREDERGNPIETGWHKDGSPIKNI